jgi:hypothetical protein
MSEDREAVLAQLLSIGTTEDPSVYKKHILSPGFKALSAFAELLANAPAEEEIQRFLATWPQFLMAVFGTRDDGDLALLYKPPIGTKFFADSPC